MLALFRHALFLKNIVQLIKLRRSSLLTAPMSF
jgi:hypothetical protein